MKLYKKEKRSGQIIVLFALLASFVMILACWVINTGQLVAHKIHLQNITDLAAYSGASVMAYHMSNMDGSGYYNVWGGTPEAVENSIAELNRRIMVEYLKFKSNVVLVNCSTSTLEALNCAFASPVPVCIVNGSAHAQRSQLNIATAIASYTSTVDNLRGMIRKLSNDATEKAKEVAKKTIANNLKNIDPNKEVHIFALPVQFDDERVDVIASHWDIQDVPFGSGLQSFCSAHPQDPIVEIYLSNLPRRLVFNPSKSTGFIVVGITERINIENYPDPVLTSDRKPIDYINWSSTFGEHSSPLFQAWAAARPYRNPLGKWVEDGWIGQYTPLDDSDDFDPPIVTVRSTINNFRKGVAGFQSGTYTGWNNLAESLIPTITALNGPPDPLFTIFDPFVVKMIPLEMGDEYGGFNPIDYFNLTSKLFGYDPYSKKALEARNQGEIVPVFLH